MALRRLIGILVVLSLSGPKVRSQTFELLSLAELPKECASLLGTYPDSTSWQSATKALEDCLTFYGHLQFSREHQKDSSGLRMVYAIGQAWQLDYINVQEDRRYPVEERSRTLQKWANAGYPFAQLKVDSLRFSDGHIGIYEALEPGPLVLIDSIPSSPEVRIPKGFLRHHFQLRQGQRFQQEVMDALEVRARQLEFLSFARPPQLLFTEEGAWIYLYPEKRRANRFDLLVGFNNAPDQATRFSGQADIRLVNAFKSGEWIDIRWQAPPDGAQQLQMEVGLPYFLGSRFWLEGGLEIYRRDSSFLNLDLNAKIRYAHRADAGIALVYRGQRSRAGSSGEEQGLLDVRKDLYGVELLIDTRDDLFSPVRGGLYRLEATGGRRRLEEESSTQYRLIGKTDVFFPLGGRHILRTGAQGGALIGEQLVENELFRIGGRNDLRGFPEQSLFSSHYGIGTLEYRYRLESSTYLQFFGDGAWRQAADGSSNAFYGLGAGISLLLERAFVQIDIAVPNSGQGFDLRSAVLHLGYAGRF